MFKPVAMTGGAGGTADAVVPAISDCSFQFPQARFVDDKSVNGWLRDPLGRKGSVIQ
jgi:hypothetical protein